MLSGSAGSLASLEAGPRAAVPVSLPLRQVLAETPSPSDSPSASDLETAAAAAVENTVEFGQVVAVVAIGVAVGLLLAVVIVSILRVALRRSTAMLMTVKGARVPMFVTLAILGGWLSLRLYGRGLTDAEQPSYYDGLSHLLLISLILSIGWLAVGAVNGFSHGYLQLIKEVAETRYRRVQTQLQILRRLINVIIVVIAISAALLTFPTARAFGASLLASAGLISVIAGIAAQSTLGNVFAGLQLAFSDSLRVNDLIVWKEITATVEEITLTYVVLKVWNGRRLIVPSSQMTTTTFENWTRRVPEMTGTVQFDLDWQAPINAIRAELNAILQSTDLWNGETGVLQVTSVDNGIIKVSAQVSANSAGEMFDLQFYVREQLLRWLQEHSPESMPRQRFYVSEGARPRSAEEADHSQEIYVLHSGEVAGEGADRAEVAGVLGTGAAEGGLAGGPADGSLSASAGEPAGVAEEGPAVEDGLDPSWRRKIWLSSDDEDELDLDTTDIGLGADVEAVERHRRSKSRRKNAARGKSGRGKNAARSAGRKAADGKRRGKQGQVARENRKPRGRAEESRSGGSAEGARLTAETKLMRPSEIMATAPKRIPIAERHLPRSYTPGEKPRTEAEHQRRPEPGRAYELEQENPQGVHPDLRVEDATARPVAGGQPGSETRAGASGVNQVDAADTGQPAVKTAPTDTQVKAGYEASLFTGSEKNESRGREYAGPGEEVLEERERTAARHNGLIDESGEGLGGRTAVMDAVEPEEKK